MEYFVVGGFSGFWVMVLSEVIPRLLVGILVHFQHFPKFPLEFNRTYFNPRVGTAGVKCLSHERNKVNSTQVLPWPLWVKHTIDRLFDVAIAVSYMKLYLWLSFCSHKFNEKMLFIATHSSELRDTYSEKWKSFFIYSSCTPKKIRNRSWPFRNWSICKKVFCVTGTSRIYFKSG